MEILVSIDPGKRDVGIALFCDGRFEQGAVSHTDWGDGATLLARTACDVAREIRALLAGRSLDHLVVEKMVAHKDRREAHGDIIDLAHVAGGILVGFEGEAKLRLLSAAEWTGGRNKKVNHVRIRRRLNEAEEAALDASLRGVMRSNHKELVDAVGIGLYHLRRL
jgi:hypothetical protein